MFSATDEAGRVVRGKGTSHGMMRSDEGSSMVIAEDPARLGSQRRGHVPSGRADSGAGFPERNRGTGTGATRGRGGGHRTCSQWQLEGRCHQGQLCPLVHSFDRCGYCGAHQHIASECDSPQDYHNTEDSSTTSHRPTHHTSARTRDPFGGGGDRSYGRGGAGDRSYGRGGAGDRLYGRGGAGAPAVGVAQETGNSDGLFVVSNPGSTAGRGKATGRIAGARESADLPVPAGRMTRIAPQLREREQREQRPRDSGPPSRGNVPSHITPYDDWETIGDPIPQPNESRPRGGKLVRKADSGAPADVLERIDQSAEPAPTQSAEPAPTAEAAPPAPKAPLSWAAVAAGRSSGDAATGPTQPAETTVSSCTTPPRARKETAATGGPNEVGHQGPPRAAASPKLRLYRKVPFPRPTSDSKVAVPSGAVLVPRVVDAGRESALLDVIKETQFKLGVVNTVAHQMSPIPSVVAALGEVLSTSADLYKGRVAFGSSAFEMPICAGVYLSILGDADAQTTPSALLSAKSDSLDKATAVGAVAIGGDAVATFPACVGNDSVIELPLDNGSALLFGRGATCPLHQRSWGYRALETPCAVFTFYC